MSTTHFGYQNIDTSEKIDRVGAVFSSVASRYDVMNDVMSGGLHRLWKNEFIKSLHAKPGSTLLDMAGGTGDIAFRFLDSVPESTVMLCDINEDMLAEGKNRAINRNDIKRLNTHVVNAEKLPFPDNSVDYYTIAFGIRNVTHIDKALKEAHRVLKPGGLFACLEFSTPPQAIIRKCYDLYSFSLIPQMGKWITGDKDSYQYLVESIRMFPDQKAFQAMIEQAGFAHVSYRNMTHGVVAIHKGWKI